MINFNEFYLKFPYKFQFIINSKDLMIKIGIINFYYVLIYLI